jgi:hypothetical protein
MTGIRFPTGAGNCSLLHHVQTGSGAHPASCPMGTRGYFPGNKAAGSQGLKLTTHLHLVPRSKECVELYLHSPKVLHSRAHNGPLTGPYSEPDESSPHFRIPFPYDSLHLSLASVLQYFSHFSFHYECYILFPSYLRFNTLIIIELLLQLGLRCVLFSISRKFGSWVRIPLQACAEALR